MALDNSAGWTKDGQYFFLQKLKPGEVIFERGLWC